MAIGLVPINGTRARVGATSGEVFDKAIPIMPSAATRNAYQPAIPKWFEARTVAPAIPRSRAASIAASTATRLAWWPQPFRPSNTVSAGRPPSTTGRAAGSITPGLDQRDVVRQPRRPVRRDTAPVGRDEDRRHVLGDIRRRPHPLDEPRCPGLKEADRDGDAVDGVSVNRHQRGW